MSLLVAAQGISALVTPSMPTSRVSMVRQPFVASPIVRSSKLLMAEELAAEWDVPKEFFDSRTPWLKNVDEYKSMYDRSISDPEGFWGDIANEFHWEEKWTSVVDANFAPSKGVVESKWFAGGKTNICYNAVDRHVADGNGDKIAFYHEGNDEGEDLKAWTYAEVQAETSKLGNLLKAKGVKPGDCVSIFMPMVPQLPIAMLACARIGAVVSAMRPWPPPAAPQSQQQGGDGEVES